MTDKTTSNTANATASLSPVLKAAWDRNRAVLAEMQALVESSPQFTEVPEQRARAYHQLMEVQAIAYNFAIAPRLISPRIFHNTGWQTDMYCSGGNGPDFHYGTMFVDGEQTYRLRGNVRDSKILLAQHNSALPGSPGARMVANYDFSDFEIAPNGDFEIILSADETPGNWIPLVREAGYQWFLLRPTVVGWGAIPADLTLERISEIALDHYSDHEFNDETVARRIDTATNYVHYMITEWMTAFYVRVRENCGGMNRLAPIGPAISGEVGSPTAEYVFIAYEVEDDEALIVEFTRAPDGVYWGAQLFDVWLRSMDFSNRQTTLNSASVHVDADGAARYVISRRDPGVANWLDNMGYRRGQFLLRNYRSSSSATGTVKRVKLADLKANLPADTKMMTPAERSEALRQRRASYLRRHGE